MIKRISFSAPSGKGKEHRLRPCGRAPKRSMLKQPVTTKVSPTIYFADHGLPVQLTASDSIHCLPFHSVQLKFRGACRGSARPRGRPRGANTEHRQLQIAHLSESTICLSALALIASSYLEIPPSWGRWRGAGGPHSRSVRLLAQRESGRLESGDELEEQLVSKTES